MDRAIADLSADQLRNMRREGFWKSDSEPNLPDPRIMVDASWDAEERTKVINYIEQAYVIPIIQCGLSWCRMGCSQVPADIGSQDLTDGTWLFAEGFVHYLRTHHVKPSAAFLDHVRRNGYKMPILKSLKTRPTSACSGRAEPAADA